MKGQEKAHRLRKGLLFVFSGLGAVLTVLTALVFLVYVFATGVPAAFALGVKDYLLGTVWNPAEGLYGILPLVGVSLVVALCGTLAAAPLGFACALFCAKAAPQDTRALLKGFARLLAGLPGVVYALCGAVLLAPALQAGALNLRSNIVILSICVVTAALVPYITHRMIVAFESVPKINEWQSLALGATDAESWWHICACGTRKELLYTVALGFVRAAGYTTAVALVAGSLQGVAAGLQGAFSVGSALLLSGGAEGEALLALRGLVACGVLAVLVSGVVARIVWKRGEDR